MKIAVEYTDNISELNSNIFEAKEKLGLEDKDISIIMTRRDFSIKTRDQLFRFKTNLNEDHLTCMGYKLILV